MLNFIELKIESLSGIVMALMPAYQPGHS